jgi:hypothetical protein
MLRCSICLIRIAPAVLKSMVIKFAGIRKVTKLLRTEIKVSRLSPPPPPLVDSAQGFTALGFFLGVCRVIRRVIRFRASRVP